MTSTGRPILCVDVGNTNVKVGLFLGEVLVGHWRVHTNPRALADEQAALLHFWLGRSGYALEDVCGVSLASTVPAVVPALRDLVARYLSPGCPLLEVTSAARTGVVIGVEHPEEMGADRIVDALAAQRLYRLPAIILDFGTATTFDAVDATGRLLGTAIAPGFQTAMDGLFARAARLSRVELRRPSSVIGRDTAEALRSGWVYGYVGLVEGLVERIKRELGGDALVIATGGLAEDVVAETRVVDVCDPLLTLQGLRLYYELNAPSVAAGP